MDRNGRFAKVLSGAALIGLMLGGVVGQAVGATDAYLVRPTKADSSGWAANVKQSWAAVCDSVDSVTVFIGAEQTGRTYTASIEDSATGQAIWTSSSRNTDGWAYEDMGFGVHVGVTRGRTYYLKLSISSGSWNFYYDGGNPFIWGRYYPIGGYGPAAANRDLAARVIGRGRVPKDFWGVNSEFPWWDNNPTHKDSLMARANKMGMKVFREQLQWSWIEPKKDTFKWYILDSVVNYAASKNISVVVNICECPLWATSAPDSLADTSRATSDTIRAKRYPPIHLTKPVFGVAGQPDTSNYYGYLIYKLVQRYGTNGSFWDSNAVPKVPVVCWEVFNETNNFYDAWNWPDTLKDSDPLYHITRGDTVGLNNLYVKACEVAWRAAKQGLNPDANAKILAGALARVHADPPYSDYNKGVLGRSWLNMFYTSTNSGKQWCDIITFHPYQHPEQDSGFNPYYFQADADTVRAIMARNGDRAKEAWGDEVGWSGVNGQSWSPTREGQATALVRLYTKAAENLNHPNGPVKPALVVYPV